MRASRESNNGYDGHDDGPTRSLAASTRIQHIGCWRSAVQAGECMLQRQRLTLPASSLAAAHRSSSTKTSMSGSCVRQSNTVCSTASSVAKPPTNSSSTSCSRRKCCKLATRSLSTESAGVRHREAGTQGSEDATQRCRRDAQRPSPSRRIPTAVQVQSAGRFCETPITHGRRCRGRCRRGTPRQPPPASSRSETSLPSYPGRSGQVRPCATLDQAAPKQHRQYLILGYSC